MVGRIDLIFLKLYALADDSPQSKHLQDLLALRPTTEELDDAADWVALQDASIEFANMLTEVVAHVRRKLDDHDF